ncbi:MAG: hypothetical protein CM15mL6_090 [uncultured marine virus]|nr:MAG: hypothetical protein CM15mL6_090 [uncultured marine virus]
MTIKYRHRHRPQNPPRSPTRVKRKVDISLPAPPVPNRAKVDFWPPNFGVPPLPPIPPPPPPERKLPFPVAPPAIPRSYSIQRMKVELIKLHRSTHRCCYGSPRPSQPPECGRLLLSEPPPKNRPHEQLPQKTWVLDPP